MNTKPAANGPAFTPLRRIATPKGEVRHGLRASDPNFAGFGEAYFTEVLPEVTKGWRLHRVMTMNLIVVSGSVGFIVHDGAVVHFDDVLSAENTEQYGRLTVPPGFWMAFQGVGRGCNLVLNIASHEHDPLEAEQRDPLDFAQFLPGPSRG